MKYITYKTNNQIVYMNSNPLLGSAIARGFQNVSELNEWMSENPDAEEIVNVLEVNDTDPLVQEIMAHVQDIRNLDKFKELQFNPEDNTVSVIESAELTRLKEEKIALFRELAQQEILDLYPIWKQSNINNLLFGATQEEKDEMNTEIETIINKCNELETTAKGKKKKETLEQIIW